MFTFNVATATSSSTIPNTKGSIPLHRRELIVFISLFPNSFARSERDSTTHRNENSSTARRYINLKNQLENNQLNKDISTF